MPLSVWLCRKHHLSTLSCSMQILQNPNFPETFPFGPEEFQRYDETPDTSFYSQPRFVTHIDDGAIAALTKCVYTEPALYFSLHHSSCILFQCCQLHSANRKGYQAFGFRVCIYVCNAGITAKCCPLQAQRTPQFLTCVAAGLATTPRATS